MSCSLTIQNLPLYQNDRLLASNINLTIGHKEKVAIIGANGCGKTTLLDTICALKAKRGGMIELFHEPINTVDDFVAIRDKVGYLLQNCDNHFLAPTAIDDIAFSLLAQGVPKQAAFDEAMKLMQQFGIDHLAQKIVYHLSGGEKKLIALAGILITKPALMLLDEPTAALDYEMQLKLTEILKNIDKSIIIVSHDKEFIESVVHSIYKITPNGLELITNSAQTHRHLHDDHSLHAAN